jgi:hypothetical protein
VANPLGSGPRNRGFKSPLPDKPVIPCNISIYERCFFRVYKGSTKNAPESGLSSCVMRYPRGFPCRLPGVSNFYRNSSIASKENAKNKKGLLPFVRQMYYHIFIGAFQCR